MVKEIFDYKKKTLDDHSKAKHRILKDYLRKYLLIRCGNVFKQSLFKLVIVDGFAGGGVYACGSPGSPVIFINTISAAFDEVNIKRHLEGKPPVSIECHFFFNELQRDTLEILKTKVAPHLYALNEKHGLSGEVNFSQRPFDQFYREYKAKIRAIGSGNILFNLDQQGYTDVHLDIIPDIMGTWDSAEIFLTFVHGAIKTFISPDLHKDHTLRNMPPEVWQEAMSIAQEEVISNTQWLARLESLLFHALRGRAPYASPFSIHNPKGWSYWLVHFARQHQARRAYNDTLHTISNGQAHFGNGGIDMLNYNPEHEGRLYLFREEDRERDRDILTEDVGRVLSKNSYAMRVSDFYQAIYNTTPSHSEDIDNALINNPQIEVKSSEKGLRRASHTIKKQDIIVLKRQGEMIFSFDLSKSSFSKKTGKKSKNNQ